MFSFAAALVVVICAVPLCIAAGFILFGSGLNIGLSVVVGLTLFCFASGAIVQRLIINNEHKQA